MTSPMSGLAVGAASGATAGALAGGATGASLQKEARFVEWICAQIDRHWGFGDKKW